MKKRWFVVILTIGLLLCVLPPSVLALSPDSITGPESSLADTDYDEVAAYDNDSADGNDPADVDDPADDTDSPTTLDDGPADDTGSTTDPAEPPVCEISGAPYTDRKSVV